MVRQVAPPAWAALQSLLSRAVDASDDEVPSDDEVDPTDDDLGDDEGELEEANVEDEYDDYEDDELYEDDRHHGRPEWH